MRSEFIRRHIGITDDQKNSMLNDLGLSTIEELVREVVAMLENLIKIL